jgi:hypothetical protein
VFAFTAFLLAAEFARGDVVVALEVTALLTAS